MINDFEVQVANNQVKTIHHKNSRFIINDKTPSVPRIYPSSIFDRIYRATPYFFFAALTLENYNFSKS